MMNSELGVEFDPEAAALVVERAHLLAARGCEAILAPNFRERRIVIAGDPNPSSNGLADVVEGVRIVWYLQPFEVERIGRVRLAPDGMSLVMAPLQ